MTGADFRHAVLDRAYTVGLKVTVQQLARAASLEGAILPDGAELGEGTWRGDWKAWCAEQARRRAERAGST